MSPEIIELARHDSWYAGTGLRSADRDLLAAALEALYVGRDNKAILVARRGVIISLNRRIADLSGRGACELLAGIGVDDLLGPEPGGRAAADSQPLRWSSSLITKAGDIPVEVLREPLGSRLPGALVYAVRDLRERRAIAEERRERTRELVERERALALQNLRFDTAINSMRQGLALLDPEKRILVCNRNFGALLGRPAGAIASGIALPDELRSCLGASSDGALPPLPETSDASATAGNPVHLRLDDGRLLSVGVRARPDGGYLVTLDDITERQRQRERLQEYTRRLERSNEELQNFAYIASHDLQEPLRKIETFTSRLVRGDRLQRTEDARADLGRIQHAAHRMRELIDDLLSYARVGTAAQRPARVDLDEVLGGVTEALAARIEAVCGQIDVEPLGVIPAHRGHMHQLFQNLVANALKFSRPGVAPLIRVTGTRETDADGRVWLSLRVVDNGIGFDNRHNEVIFRIFHRLHGRHEYEGTGIGLATCRKIVEAHGGWIQADGRPGAGATFTIRLPADAGDAALPRPA